MVVVFPLISVAGKNLIYGYNFLGLYFVTSTHEQLLEKDNSVSIHRKDKIQALAINPLMPGGNKKVPHI